MAKGGSGGDLGGGSGKDINIVSQTDVWSFRHNRNNEPFVDAINTGVSVIQNDFNDVMDSVNVVNASELSGSDKQNVLGFYGGGALGINTNYTNIDKMNAVYDNAVKSGFHPSRGNKTGTEAVTIHEMGHALTDHLGKKLGATTLDDAAKTIVDRAYKNSGGKGGTKAWAKKISGYAAENNAECIAEAVADWYCNGNNAHANSKAIMGVLKSI